jgi:metallo-beta-lactamase family protein
MAFSLQFYGATERVTGSLYLLRTARHTVMLECGLIQGGRAEEAKNRDPFPVAINEIDAVVISHAHIDHSGVRRQRLWDRYRSGLRESFCSS